MSQKNLPFHRRTLLAIWTFNLMRMSENVTTRPSAARNLAPVTHYPRTVSAGGKRPVTRSRGILEVMRVQRVDIRSVETDTLVILNGVPASATSGLRTVLMRFRTALTGAQPTRFNAQDGSLELHYPAVEMDMVMRILTTRRKRLCYHWRTEDGSSDLSWLFAV